MASANAARTGAGATALMAASTAGHLKVAKELLDRGADPNAARADNGGTALMDASHGGHREMAQRLVVHGANIAAKSSKHIPLRFFCYKLFLNRLPQIFF